MSLQEELSAAAAQNFGAILDRQADAHPDHVAFLTPVGGSDEPNEWVPLTFAQFRRQAHDVAAGLLELSVVPLRAQTLVSALSARGWAAHLVETA